MTRKTLKEVAERLDRYMDRDENNYYGNGWGDPEEGDEER
jgi:hypothetical protein